jgi:hypothetical protein
MFKLIHQIGFRAVKNYPETLQVVSKKLCCLNKNNQFFVNYDAINQLHGTRKE